MQQKEGMLPIYFGITLRRVEFVLGKHFSSTRLETYGTVVFPFNLFSIHRAPGTLRSLLSVL